MDLVKASKQLSYVLRHRPDSIGITLAPDGWVEIGVLLNALAANGTRLSKADLVRLVAENDKQRFAIDGDRIRASQGHSVEVELGYAAATPPGVLFHGTAERRLASIFDKGLVRGRRHHVHLSADPHTALKVGARHGKPVVLTVDAAKMLSGGYQFHVSENGVWLTEAVPAEYLRRT
ncbi:MAG TPA: RNA 2'-phosphotransferase [Micromonosporaceae bacterium]|nr:RNA 2'-phosphotransferase [Micromonosporaceae bacterium]